jgi:CrcB protein
MLIYFWVGLGGALGAMVRLWLGVQVALLTGLRFPWGTVLVNILGSLVIGFVATLTGPNGRVVVPVPAQAFVMVGMSAGLRPSPPSVFRHWSSREAGGCCMPGPT